MLRIFCFLPVLFAQVVLADECDVADMLRDAGKHTQAHSAYEALLKKSPLLPCAADGYITTTNHAIVNALATSKTHQQRKDYSAAVDNYEIALALVSDKSGDPRVNLDGLAKLKTEAAQTLIERAQLLAKGGATVLALASFNEALEYAPGAQDALKGISKLQLDTDLAQVRTMASLGDFAGAAAALGEASEYKPGLYTAAVVDVPGLSRFASYQNFYESSKQIAIFTIIVFIVGFLLYRLFVRYLRPPALTFQAFDTSSIDQKLGEAIDTAIKAYMDDLTRGSGGGDVSVRIEQSVEQFEIPSAITQTLPTQLSFASAIPELVQKIFPRKVQTVTGSLHFTDKLGCGITVNLESPGRRALTGYTFWQAKYESKKEDGYGSELDSTAPYFDLCQYVAVWLLYAIDARGRFKPLGCTNWGAYVSFRTGVIEEFKAEPDKKFARSCYVRALNLQPDFNAPRYNLALQAGRDEYQFTLEPLQRAADNGDPDDPTTYSARYMLANRKYVLGEPKNAQAQALQLIDEIKERKKVLERGNLLTRTSHTAQNRKTLTSFLDVTLRVAESMHIGLSLLIDRDIKLVQELDKLRSEVVTPRGHYNVACGYSLAAQVLREEREAAAAKDDDPGERVKYDGRPLTYDKLITTGILSLQTSLFLAPEYKEKVTGDSSLTELLRHYDPTSESEHGFKRLTAFSDAGE